MQAVLKRAPGVWLALAVMVSSYYAMTETGNGTTRSDDHKSIQKYAKTQAWDPRRFVPVYGHIPFWSKRLGSRLQSIEQ